MRSIRFRRYLAATGLAVGLAAAIGLPQSWSMGSRVPAVGMPVDEFRLTDLEGKTHSLSQYRGKVVLERYALGLQEHDRWSTMSTVKSMTAVLVGAALHDGSLDSIDAPLTRYLPSLGGSAYEGVTLRHLLSMTSGIADWIDEDADDYDEEWTQFCRQHPLYLLHSDADYFPCTKCRMSFCIIDFGRLLKSAGLP